MPDVSGFEVLDALKSNAETRQIPVVIYTSQRLESEERERLQAAIDIVPKETQSRELTEIRFMEVLARAGLHANTRDGAHV
jgi:CheY-like chemotaxis protein